MHMTDSLLSPTVGTAMCAVSAAALAFSVSKVKKDDLCEKKIPIIGVMGAFVFAAQRNKAGKHNGGFHTEKNRFSARL